MDSGSQPRLWVRAGAETQLRAGIPQLLVKGGIAQVQLQKLHKNAPSSPGALVGVVQKLKLFHTETQTPSLRWGQTLPLQGMLAIQGLPQCAGLGMPVEKFS